MAVTATAASHYRNTTVTRNSLLYLRIATIKNSWLLLFFMRLIVKRRHKKGYRVKELDERLRLSRTKREARIMEKLKELGIAVPKLVFADEKKTTLEMEFIEGKKLREVLSSENCQKFCEEAGEKIGIMHSNNIIHGDLTTSNIINGSGNKLHFIDFGLGFFSDKSEDKAVDLHLLKQALNSSHSKIAEKCFAAVVNGYKKTNSGSSEILKRLEKVESRGRHKGKKERLKLFNLG